jgi:hypothetical protein
MKVKYCIVLDSEGAMWEQEEYLEKLLLKI